MSRLLSIEELYNLGLDVGYSAWGHAQGSKKNPDPGEFFGTKFIFYVRVPIQSKVIGDEILTKLSTIGAEIIQFLGHIGYVSEISSDGKSNFCYDTEIWMYMHHSYTDDIKNCSKEIGRCVSDRQSALISSRHIAGYKPPWTSIYSEGQE